MAPFPLEVAAPPEETGVADLASQPLNIGYQDQQTYPEEDMEDRLTALEADIEALNVSLEPVRACDDDIRRDGTTGGRSPGGDSGRDGRGGSTDTSGGRGGGHGDAGSTGGGRGRSTTAGDTSSAGGRGSRGVQAVGGRTGLDGNGGRVDNVSLRVGQSDGDRGTGGKRDGPDVRSVGGTIGEGLESGGRSLTTGDDGPRGQYECFGRELELQARHTGCKGPYHPAS